MRPQRVQTGPHHRAQSSGLATAGWRLLASLGFGASTALLVFGILLLVLPAVTA